MTNPCSLSQAKKVKFCPTWKQMTQDFWRAKTLASFFQQNDDSEVFLFFLLCDFNFGHLCKPKRLLRCGLSRSAKLHRNCLRDRCLLPQMYGKGMHLRRVPVLRLYPSWLPKRESPRGRILLCGFRKHGMLLSSGRREDKLSFHSVSWNSPKLHWCFTTCRWMLWVWADRLYPRQQEIWGRTLFSGRQLPSLSLSKWRGQDNVLTHPWLWLTQCW